MGIPAKEYKLMSEKVTPVIIDEPCKLMIVTQQLLKDDPRSILSIYEQSGIPFHWLKKFANNEFKNPSVNRVSCLYTFLTGKDVIK